MTKIKRFPVDDVRGVTVGTQTRATQRPLAVSRRHAIFSIVFKEHCTRPSLDLEVVVGGDYDATVRSAAAEVSCSGACPLTE